MGTIQQAIQDTLDEIGRALSEDDAATAARLWHVPGLVVADEGTRAITHIDEVEEFFKGAITWYRSQGTPQTRPDIQNVSPLTDRLAAVDVRWPGFDEGGAEVSSETSHYIMLLADDGIARICVAMSRTG